MKQKPGSKLEHVDYKSMAASVHKNDRKFLLSKIYNFLQTDNAIKFEIYKIEI